MADLQFHAVLLNNINLIVELKLRGKTSKFYEIEIAKYQVYLK